MVEKRDTEKKREVEKGVWYEESKENNIDLKTMSEKEFWIWLLALRTYWKWIWAYEIFRGIFCQRKHEPVLSLGLLENLKQPWEINGLQKVRRL